MPTWGGRRRRTRKFPELVESLELAVGTLEARGVSPARIAPVKGRLEEAAGYQRELEATGEIRNAGFKDWCDWVRSTMWWVSELDSDLERILSLGQGEDVPDGFDLRSCFCGCGTEVGAELYAANRAGAEVLKELSLQQDIAMVFTAKRVDISPCPSKTAESCLGRNAAKNGSQAPGYA